MDLWIRILFLTATNVIDYTEQEKVVTKDEFALSEQLQLSMRYCSMKNGSKSTHKQHFHGNCLRRWNKKYARFCQRSSYSGSEACVRLKKKMKTTLEKMIISRTRTFTGNCTVGQKYKVFDPEIQFCCENHIWKKRYKNHTICCDKVFDDGSKNKCCNSSYISLSALKKAKCCGKKLIDEDNQACDDEEHTTNNIIPEPSPTTTFYEGLNYKEKIDQRQNDLERHFPSKLVVYVCMSVLLVVLSVVIVGVCKWTRVKATCASNTFELRYLNQENQSHRHSYGTLTIPSSIQLSHMTRSHSPLHQQSRGIERFQSLSQSSEETSFMSASFVQSDKINKSPIDTVTIQTQTESRKEINIKNSMGRGFCVQHTFTKSRRTLQIQDSAAKLTLSEVDLQSNPKMCYASTFRNLTEIYSKLDQVMSPKETIVSPAVEYFFPACKRLNEFACIDMEIGGRGKDFHVWKVKSDQGSSKSKEREEIPLKKNSEVSDDTIDAYYETFGGKIRIFLKTFSWLVCTACGLNHYGYNLSAWIYVKNEPHTHLSKQVRVTVYILDGVRQLDDYLKVITEDKKSLKLTRKVNLPDYVSLEESLAVRLILMGETLNTWRHLYNDSEDMDETEYVPVKHITQCHQFKSNDQPFSIDWHFESIPYSITSGRFTFQCIIKMTILPKHQVVTMKIPPNRYVINEEIDFSMVKKRPINDENTDIPEVPVSHIHQPSSALHALARPEERVEDHRQHEYARNNQTTRQRQDINQNAEECFDPQMTNGSRAPGTRQTRLPRPYLQSINYEAQGARPRTSNINRGPDNIQRINRTSKNQHNSDQSHRPVINSTSNNCHDRIYGGALPFAKSEPNIRVNDGNSDVRGELSQSIN